MDKQVEKEIKNLVEDNVASWFLIRYLRKAEEKVRAKIFEKIIYGILGAAFASGIITFIFRKEIAEMITDAEKITKESLLRFVNLVRKFKKK